jgi:alcohol dehydrogenase (cytochrome c)/quinohemoprotein ethanol dehydrogenase
MPNPARSFKLALAAALAFSSCATGQGPKSSQTSDPTRELFERNCAVCHGHEGEGRQIGTLNVPSLREGRAATDPDERLLRQIHDGGGGMPPFKFTLTDEQIESLLRFVREDLQARAAKKQ